MTSEIINVINAMPDSEIIEIHNRYCEEINDCDSCAVDMDLFNEYLAHLAPLTIASMVSHDDFNPNDNYFTFDGYGFCNTFNSPHDSDSPVCIEDIADYIISYDDDFGYASIREAMPDIYDDEND